MTVRVVSLTSFASATGVLTVGQSVTFIATTNRPVVVEGIPTLITSDGQVAFYVAALSTPTALAFRYTVGLQETSSNLTVVAMTTNGGSITGEAKLFLDGPKQYSTGDAPRDIAVADVNGDGKLDLVTANDGGNSVSVLLGTSPAGSSLTGNFGFTDATHYDAGPRPSSLAIGDFNNNGKLDIAVTNLLANTVTVLDGEGNGYFETLPSDPTGAGPVSVTAADLDGDGNLDLVVTINNRKVSVLPGDGQFNFVNGATYGVGSSPVASAAADIDGDGDPDVFVVNQNGNSVSVLLNDGLGGFGNGGTLRVGASPTDILAVDVNDDGDIDLVITNSGDDTVSVLLGDGNGGFAPAIVSNAPNNPLAVAAGDVSGDGTIDLVVVSDDGVSVLEGRGNGSFGLPETWAAGGRPTDVVVADFNKDGLADIVVTNANDDTVSVFKNTSDREESMFLPSIVLNAGTVTGFVIDGGVPSVISRAAAAGTFGAGATLEIRIVFSESVVVSGVPRLTLNSGGTATYVSGTNTDTLVFTTTVAAGQNATNLGVTGLTLPTGARIVDENGNNVSLAEAPGTIGGVVVDTTRPTVAVDDDATPDSGRFGTGQVITITITGNEKLFVTGTPTLELNNGGTATYVSGSGTADLLFRYTIGTGQDTANLAVTGVALPGSTIRDAAGNDAILTGASATFTGLNIDTTAPVVVGIAATPGSGSFDVGQVITFTLTMSEAVSVSGNPVLQLNDGGTATYVGGNGTTTLVFSTTVAAGQNADALAVTGVTLPDGASIRAATVSAPDAYLASAAETFDAVSVNTSFPFVEALVATPGDAVFGAGAVVTLTLVMSKNVTVSGGTPFLTLDDGSVATYVSGSGTDRLVFTSVVAPGQTSPDLSVTAINLDGAVIADGAGRPAGLAGAVGNPAGTLVIDAGAVTITAFAATASETGPLGVGDVVTFTATVDRAIVVTTTDGAPTLALNDGGTATYDAAASTATTLVFHHTVAAGQNASNLAVEALVLNGATVAVPDTPLSLSTPSTYHYGDFPNPSDSTAIGDLDGDGIPDIVISNYGALSILLGDGGGGFLSPITYRPEDAGGTIFIASGPAVIVDVNRDGNADVVVPSRNTGGISVALGDGDGNLGVPTHIDTREGEYAFSANSLTVADLNRDGAPDLVVGTGSFFTGTDHAIVVMSGDGNGGFGVATPFASGMSANSIQVADMNRDGHLDVVAAGAVLSGTLGRVEVMYGDGNGGLGAATTVFTAQSEFPNELVVADLNGDGRLDVAALDFGADKLSFALADGSGGFAPVTLLDTGDEPSGLAAADVNGDGKLDFVVSNTRGGDLQVFLGNGSGGFAAPVSFVAGSGDIQRLGSVAAGDLNGDGRPDFVGTEWYSGNVFVLLNETLSPNVFDPDGAAGATGSQTGLVVDTAAPHIVSGTANPGRGVYDVGQTITFTLTGDEPLIVTGAPVVTLNNGATATYVGGSGTASLQFRTTVAAGRDATALAVTGVSLPAGTTIRDAAGNDADLSGAPASFPGLSIVTTPPRVVSVAASQADGTLGAGSVVTLELVLDKIVAVSRGVPTLTLSDGGSAIYVSGSGTNTLLFTTTVATGQATPDLAVTAVNLNGAAVTDLRGQTANLSGAVVNPAGILAVSAPAVTVLDIDATPSVSGPLGAGSTVSFTVTLAGAVTVSGTPVLTLDDGGIATYDAAASTATSLVFRHTVLAGQNTADLTVTGLTLNGAGVSVPGGLSFGAPAVAATDLGNATGSTVADVNGDGRLDAIVTMDGSYKVSVMLGTAGGFGPATAYDLGPHDGSPVIGNASGGAVVAADVNRDGRLDLIVADQGAGTVSLLLGTGAGGFAPATTIRHDTGGFQPRDVTVADVNGDGNADLLVAGVTAVTLMLGDGAGGFGAPGSYEMGFGINGLATADVNGDGRLDLIASFMGNSSDGDFDTGGVSVRLGNGGSGFGPFVSHFESAVTYGAGQSPNAVLAADVNRDGRPDLVVANYLGHDVSVLLGNGFGGFGAATNYAGGLGALAIAAADLDGDGMVDLAVSDVSGEIDVLRGNGAGGFGAPMTLRTNSVTGIGNLVALSAVDVNGDGRPDLVVTSSGGEVVTLLNLSAAPGTFTFGGIAAAPGASTGLVVDTTSDHFTFIRGTSAGETLVGDAGKNVIFARGGNDIVHGLAGDDELSGDEGNDFVYGDEGNDILYGDAGDDTLRGDTGNDHLDGGTGADQMAGGLGNDIYVVDAATDKVIEKNGEGTDLVQSSVSFSLARQYIENLTLTGADNIDGTGNTLANILTGNAGNNILDGGAGADQMAGGLGNDTYVVDAVTDTVIEKNGQGTDLVQSSVTFSLARQYVENLTLTGTAHINGTGNSLANVLTGNAGNNILHGGAGNDALDGGAGTDTADYSDKTTSVVVTLNGATNAGVTVGGVAEDTIRNIENVTGGSGADVLTGDALANALVGGAGNDVLKGGAGNDTLDGGTGADQMEGGLGDDIYVVDAAGDKVIENNGQGTDLVRSSATFSLARQYIENLTLTGTGNINGTGNSLANILTGNAGDNILHGGAGNDALDGGAGTDTADYSDKTTSVVVTLNGASVTSVTVGGVAEDTLRNIENVTGGSGADVLTGDALANALVGGAGNDVLKGGAGNDTLDGGTGADQMEGGLGNDTYVVDAAGDTVIEKNGEGTDLVRSSATFSLARQYIENLTLTGTGNINGTGNSLANILTGNAGNNVLDGGTGNDVLKGGLGNDVLDGGDGLDTADYSDKTSSVVVTLNGSTNAIVTVGGIAEDTLRNIENVTGGSGADTLAGDALANALVGGAGNDVLKGGLGNDMLDGGDGVDTADYSDKTTSVVVTLNGATNAGVTVGGVAEDTLRNIENVTGGSGNDTLIGDSLANTLVGGAGNDHLDGGTGADQMAGGLGNDTYVVDAAGDTVIEMNGQGTDLVRSSATFSLARQYIENLTLTGTAHINGTGNSLANILTGNAGDNILHGGAGNDALDGGAGTDTADYSDKTISVVLTLNGSSAASVTVGGIAEDTLRNIENATGGSGNDTLTGDALANALVGGAGNDVLRGGLGMDALDGGTGVDTADYSDKTASVVVTLNGATNAGVTVGGIAEDTIRNTENLTGGSGNDMLTGDALANTLVGGAGNDVLKGGLGNDMLDGGTGVDTADYSDKTASVVVTLNGATNAGVTVGGVAEDTLHNIENVTGGSGNDTLTGDALANTLVGGAGNDHLDGGTGADQMAGGLGNDTYVVDAATDKVIENNGEGTDLVQSSATFSLARQYIENLTLTGAGNINGTGNSLDNTITGNAGNNVLTGGGGSDFFVFNTALGASNIDVITDFSVAADTILLDDAIFSAIVGTGTLSAGQFVANSSGTAQDSSDRIIYETDTGKLFYDGNGSAAGQSIQFAQLDAGLAITNLDFLIV